MEEGFGLNGLAQCQEVEEEVEMTEGLVLGHAGRFILLIVVITVANRVITLMTVNYTVEEKGMLKFEMAYVVSNQHQIKSFI